MRLRSIPHILTIGSAWLLSGCGTVANFASLKPKVYGGVARDMKYLDDGMAGMPRLGPKAVLVLVPVCCAIVGTELCCTALGDTMTLPLTKVLDKDWQLREAEKPIPEHTEDPIAFGVNGPFLWEPATKGPTSP
jgi:hypothetical protein